MARTIAHDVLEMVEYAHAPSILVFADGAAAVERATCSIEALGYRISGVAGISEAAARLDRQVAVSAVWVEPGDEPGADFDSLLDRLEAGAAAGQFGSVVSASEELIDWVAARTSHERVIHLCRPSQAQRLTALAMAAANSPARLHDVRRQQAPGRLQQLSEEVGRIANILATLSEDDSDLAAAAPVSDARGGGIEAGQVRAIIRARRLRDQYFSANLFADPAWDMLLDLLAARLEHRQVAVSSLCIAAAVPATTALRWIKTLTDEGLFVRRADPQDGRRVYIELSDGAAAGLEAYLVAAQRISPLLV